MMPESSSQTTFLMHACYGSESIHELTVFIWIFFPSKSLRTQESVEINMFLLPPVIV